MTSTSSKFRHFIIEPLKNRSAALFWLQVVQILHDRASGLADRPIQRLIALLHPKIDLPDSMLMGPEMIAESVVSLKKRGWHILPFTLPRESVKEISNFAFTTPAYAKAPAEQIDITAENPPRLQPRYEWRIEKLMTLPAIQNLLCDSALHKIAQDYIGCRPILTSITLWLDSIYEGTYDSHIYHCDNDGPTFLKFFIYLTDVDMDSGAHTYIQKSHSHIKPKAFRRSIRYQAEDLLAHYGPENEIVFSAPAGTILAEDTAGYHRGTTPKNHPRLLLQIQYAAMDIPHVEEFTLGITPVKIDHMNQSIKRIAKKFVT